MQPGKKTFFALGRADNPRWLAPAGYRPHDESFLGWQPYRLTSRFAWSAMKSVVRWGVAPAKLPPDNFYVKCIADLDWRKLGWCHTAEPEPLVYLGTPGPRRKAVVHLVDPVSHACELIVKVPMQDAAKRAICHEAQTLLELQREGFVAAPRLVSLDEAAGIASQTVVTGARAGLSGTREVAVLLQSLERRGESITLRQVASSLEPKASRLDVTAADAAAVTRALAQMDDPSGLPAVRIHGDFAAWNIKLQNGAAALLDWEDSQPRGLPLLDAFHFVHIARCLFGKRPRPVWHELRFRYAFHLTAAQRRQLELAYLLQMLVRESPRPQQTYETFLLATLRQAVAERP